MNRTQLRGRWPWAAGGVTVMLVIVAIVALPEVRATLNSNQGAISLVLTAMLVLLYIAQYRLDGRQVLLANATAVEIQRYEVDGKKIELWLSNVGNGPAVDISLETVSDFTPTELRSPGSAWARLRRVGEDGDPKKRVGNSLKAGEHNVRFIGEPNIEISPDDEFDGWGLVAGTSRLAEEGVEEVGLEFYVVSRDLLGNEDRESIFGWPFKVELPPRGVDLESARANAHSHFREQ